MDATGYVAIIASLVTLVGAIAAAAVTVIKALKENTRVTMANTEDRAVKSQSTNRKLDAVVEAVGATKTGADSDVPA